MTAKRERVPKVHEATDFERRIAELLQRHISQQKTPAGAVTWTWDAWVEAERIWKTDPAFGCAIARVLMEHPCNDTEGNFQAGKSAQIALLAAIRRDILDNPTVPVERLRARRRASTEYTQEARTHEETRLQKFYTKYGFHTAETQRAERVRAIVFAQSGEGLPEELQTPISEGIKQNLAPTDPQMRAALEAADRWRAEHFNLDQLQDADIFFEVVRDERAVDSANVLALLDPSRPKPPDYVDLNLSDLTLQAHDGKPSYVEPGTYDFEIQKTAFVDHPRDSQKRFLRVTASVISGPMHNRMMVQSYVIADEQFARLRLKSLVDAAQVPLDKNGSFNHQALIGQCFTAEVVDDVVDGKRYNAWIGERPLRQPAPKLEVTPPQAVPPKNPGFTDKDKEVQAAREAQQAKKKAAAQLPANLRAYIREPDGASCWVDLDGQQLPQQLKEIIDGPFDVITWENAAPGIHLLQLVGRTELSPSVWLRGRANARGPSAGSRKVLVNGKRVSVPLTRFVPTALATLLDADIQLIESKFYTAPATGPGTPAQPGDIPPAKPGDIDQATHEAIIVNYLQICQLVNAAALNGDEDAGRIWPQLRDAVIFEFPTTTHTMLFDEFARYLMRSAKVDATRSQLTPAAAKRIREVISSGAEAPFPTKMPFPSCFFAYGAGAGPAVSLIGAAANVTYGHLVCANGVVVSFYQESGALRFAFERMHDSLQWAEPQTLAPWIVNALVDYVNEHKTLIEMGRCGAVHRTRVKRINTGLGAQPSVPPPFYIVYMKDAYMREAGARQADTIKRHIDWQHRWKVRGHDCIRFARGPLPLDPEISDSFLKRGYKVFTDSSPDAETFADLLRRGVPEKGPDEWIAILKFWRNPHEKGPEDKPLIESVRRSTKGWTPLLPDDVN